MKKVFLLLCLALCIANVQAQFFDPVKWSIEFKDLPSAEKEIVLIYNFTSQSVQMPREYLFYLYFSIPSIPALEIHNRPFYIRFTKVRKISISIPKFGVRRLP